jgi:hypothetical protein
MLITCKKLPRVPILYDTGWAAEFVCTLRKREKHLPLQGIELFPAALGLEVHFASNRNEYQK